MVSVFIFAFAMINAEAIKITNKIKKPFFLNIYDHIPNIYYYVTIISCDSCNLNNMLYFFLD